MTKRSFILIALLIAGCSENPPSAPTAEQSEQLNEAEDLLNEGADGPDR